MTFPQDASLNSYQITGHLSVPAVIRNQNVSVSDGSYSTLESDLQVIELNLEIVIVIIITVTDTKERVSDSFASPLHVESDVLLLIHCISTTQGMNTASILYQL